MAQWSDGFEAYAVGPLNAGGWDGWGGDPGARGIVDSTVAHTGEKSIQITGGGDAIHPFAGEFTSGQWTLSAWMLLNRNDHTADTYFIVMNEYTGVAPWGTWAVQMQFDVTTGTLIDDIHGGTPLPIAYDRWAEISLEIDLDADSMTTSYDGNVLSTGSYTGTAGDPLEIANIDLFTTGATSYFDDLSIVPEPSSCLLVLIGVGAMLRRRR